MTTLKAAGSTDAGQVRSQNQDAFFAAGDLVLIADGMGGYAGGEVAAAMAADTVEEQFHADATADGLRDALVEANRRIYDRGVEPGLEGMGTTLVAVAVVASPSGERLLLANVGDSRCYLLRDGALRQLSEDHSVAAELVRMGRIEEHEEAEHPGRHVLTRVLGVELDVEPDLVELDPREGDRFLLCSDGLSNELDDDAIRALLAVGEPADAARALVASANAHGGLDNITAVVADVDDVPPDQGPRTTAVPVVAAGAAGSAGAAGTIAERSGVAAPLDAPVEVPPAPRVLTGRERRRRRREDRRERRRHNKWISVRGWLFLLAVAVVVVGAWFVLRWYGTASYYVTIRSNHAVVIQGREGGFLWWQPKVVVIEPFGRAQLPSQIAKLVDAGVDQATLEDARQYLENWHQTWLDSKNRVTVTTTTTTSTTIVPTISGGN